MNDNSMSTGVVLDQEIDFQKFIDPLQFTLGVLDEINISFLDIYSEDNEFLVNSGFFKHLFENMLTQMGKIKPKIGIKKQDEKEDTTKRD